MSVRLTAASSQRFNDNGPFAWNAAYSFLGLVYFVTRGTPYVWSANGASAANEGLFLNASNKLVYRAATSSTAVDITGTTTILATTWYYWGLRRNSATQHELFVGTTPTGLASEGTQTLDVSARGVMFGFGLGTDVLGASYLDGRLRGCRVYQSQLTLAEMQTELASLDVSVKAGCFSAWALATAGTYTDTTGNARPLVATGTPTTEADPTTQLDVAVATLCYTAPQSNLQLSGAGGGLALASSALAACSAE